MVIVEVPSTDHIGYHLVKIFDTSDLELVTCQMISRGGTVTIFSKRSSRSCSITTDTRIERIV